jgi:hypothetical protein
MKSNRSRRLPHYFTILMAGLTMQRAAVAEDVYQRPIEDFVNAQGAQADFAPYDYVGWLSVADKQPTLFAMVDYAGVTNKALDLGIRTTFGGSITERPLADGRAEVVVTLQTRNALTLVVDLDEVHDPYDFHCTRCKVLFGSIGADVKHEAAPALGNSFLQLVMKNTAIGAPLPDIFSAFVTGNTYQNGQELISISFHAKAVGLLSNGEEGAVKIDQIGRVAMVGQGNVFQDEFDIEKVEVKPADISGSSLRH